MAAEATVVGMEGVATVAVMVERRSPRLRSIARHVAQPSRRTCNLRRTRLWQQHAFPSWSRRAYRRIASP